MYVQALSNALLAPIPFSLTKMAAVQYQRICPVHSLMNESINDTLLQALSNALLAPIPFSLTKMAAVQDQRKRCERWKEKFSKVISTTTIQYKTEQGEVHLPYYLCL